MFGNSSAGFAIRSYTPPMFVLIFTLLSWSDESSILVLSGSSFVMFSSVCNGNAEAPSVSMLAGRFVIIVISRSVVLKTTPPLLTSKRTLLKIGMVDLVGIALESFCKAVCS